MQKAAILVSFLLQLIPAILCAQLPDIDDCVIYTPEHVREAGITRQTGWLLPQQSFIRNYDTSKIAGAGLKRILYSEFFFDAGGNPVLKKEYNVYGGIREVTYYNSKGKPIKKKLVRWVSSKKTSGYNYVFHYDSGGTVLQSYEVCSFDSLHRKRKKTVQTKPFLVCELQYDSLHRIRQINVHTPGQPDTTTVLYNYNSQNQLVRITAMNDLGNPGILSYDESGKLTESRGTGDLLMDYNYDVNYRYIDTSLPDQAILKNQGVVLFEYR